MPVATTTASPEPRVTAVPLKSIEDRSASGASGTTGSAPLSMGRDSPVRGDSSA
jgi:hypothetical protein